MKPVRHLAVLALASLAGAAGAQAQTAAASLRVFEGRWDCTGAFASGKPTAAILSASWDAPAQALVLRHDDKPPGGFHALELWGAHGAAGFRASISDAYSGIRWLDSPGWADDRLTWTRTEAGRPAEQFVFSRPRDGTFTVEWSPANKAGVLVPGDTLTCKAA
jgi:hypothetical protein